MPSSGGNATGSGKAANAMATLLAQSEHSGGGGESEFQRMLQMHEEQIQVISDEQLEQLIDDTLRANDILETETTMFEKYLKRIDPREAMQSLQAAASSATRPNFGSLATISSSTSDNVAGKGSMGGSGTSRMSRRSRSKSRSSAVEKMLKLSAEQKCDIALREKEEYELEVRRENEAAEKILENLYAIAEEAEVRLSEIKKEQYEFDRDMLRSDRKNKTRPSAEKVARYIEDKLRDRESLIVKLRLKNTALKIMKKKLQMQLKQKEEMGEVLHEIDFQQLKIENQQYIERIDERNKDLLQLKLMSGQTMSVLNAYKKRLGILMLESERLQSDTASRIELLDRLDAETRVADSEKAAAERVNMKLKQQLSEYKVPEVLDYVKEKALLYDLNKQEKMWQRKVNIAQMALDSQRKTWSGIRSSGAEPITHSHQTTPHHTHAAKSTA